MWLKILECLIALPGPDNYKKLLRGHIIDAYPNQYQSYIFHSINTQYYLTYSLLSNSYS